MLEVNIILIINSQTTLVYVLSSTKYEFTLKLYH